MINEEWVVLSFLLHQHLAEHVLIQAAFPYGRVAVDDGEGIPAAVASVGIAAHAIYVRFFKKGGGNGNCDGNCSGGCGGCCG